MTKVVAILVLASMGPCGLFGDCDHGGKITPADAIPEDPRLGTRITDAMTSTRFFFSPFYGSDQLYVLVYEGPTLTEELTPTDLESVKAYAVDPDTGMVQELPDPPFTPAREVRAWRVLEGAGLLAGVRSDASPALAFYDGSTWTAVDPPPRYVELEGNILARSADQMLAFWWDGRDAVMRFDGSAWAAFGPSDATDVGVMSWEEDEVRFVYLADRFMCTQLWSFASNAAADTEVCFDVPVRDIDWNTNGTLQTFQVHAQTEALPSNEWQAVTFDGGVFTPGQIGTLPNTTFPAPGSRRIITLAQEQDARDAMLNERVFLENGVETGTAMGPFEMRTQCDCNRSADEDCECVVRGPTVWAARFHPDTTRGVILWLDDLDAHRRLYARFLDLPATDEPYASSNPIDFDAGPPVCDVICDPGDTCIFNSLGEKLCVPFDMVPDGGVLLVDGGPIDVGPDTTGMPLGASLFADVRLTDDTLATVTLESVDGGPVMPFEIEDEPTGQVVRMTSFADYRVTFSGANHASASIDIRTEGFDSAVNLGAHVLNRGVRLGDAFNRVSDDHGVAVSPTDDVLVAATSDAWVVVRRVSGRIEITEVVGLTPRLTEGFEWASSTFTPDGAFALVDTTGGLSLLRMPSGEVVATLPGGPYDLGQISFADAAPVFSVRSATTHMPTGRGEASVIRYGASELTSLLRVTDEGWREHVRADGAELVRVQGTQVLAHDVGTGDATVIASADEQSHVMVTYDGRAVVVAEPSGSSARLRRRCWEEPGGCSLRIIDRVVAGVETVALSGGFHVAATANIVAWQEAGQVGFYDTVADARTSVIIDGLSLMTRLGARDRFAVLGSAGPSIIDLPSRSVVDTGPSSGAGALGQLPYRRVDGTVLVNRSPSCATDCSTLFIEPTIPRSTALVGTSGLGVIAGAYTPFPRELVVIPTGGGLAVTLGGAPAVGIDQRFATALGHGAPCMVFDVVDAEPQLTTGVYCAP